MPNDWLHAHTHTCWVPQRVLFPQPFAKWLSQWPRNGPAVFQDWQLGPGLTEVYKLSPMTSRTRHHPLHTLRDQREIIVKMFRLDDATLSSSYFFCNFRLCFFTQPWSWTKQHHDHSSRFPVGHMTSWPRENVCGKLSQNWSPSCTTFQLQIWLPFQAGVRIIFRPISLHWAGLHQQQKQLLCFAGGRNVSLFHQPWSRDLLFSSTSGKDLPNNSSNSESHGDATFFVFINSSRFSAWVESRVGGPWKLGICGLSKPLARVTNRAANPSQGVVKTQR